MFPVSYSETRPSKSIRLSSIQHTAPPHSNAKERERLIKKKKHNAFLSFVKKKALKQENSKM
jgi:hypothetical protein